MVDEGQREGIIESDAGQMIHRVMELQHEDVAAINDAPHGNVLHVGGMEA
ncbi:MAG: hypothetical protein U0872_11435 [Planctomycetaceae bacterium]